MRVAVVDIGANTARLVVAEPSTRGLASLLERRFPLGLGAEIERDGLISRRKLAEVSKAAARSVAAARSAYAERVDILITSPGRQSRNHDELTAAILRGCGLRPRVLSAEDEARLAYRGALLAAATDPAGTVAVCDVGGGSAQVAVGTPTVGPACIRSIDLGSLRLTCRYLGGDPPSRRKLLAAAGAVEHALEHMTLPLPHSALAVGGTARALKRIVGPRLGQEELELALTILRSHRAHQIASKYGIPRWRADVLPGGALLVAGIQRLLAVPLEVVRGGIREGAALALIEQAAAAA